MTAWMRSIHKWIGLIVGIQFVLWLVSGLAMSLLNPEQVAGRQSRVKASVERPWPVAAALPVRSVIASAVSPVRAITTGWLLGQPVYLLDGAHGMRIHDALTGHIIPIDASRALRLALSSYMGKGIPGTPRLLAKTSEVRSHSGPIWAIDFADADDTTVYLDANSGTVLEHRNRTWRLFDTFWMLHIMDYTSRQDFNNPLVIASGLGGLWLALTGAWLLFVSVRLAEFVPMRRRTTRVLTLVSPGLEQTRPVSAAAGETILTALARNGVVLPSNCGGGQSCGLCEVRLLGNAPPASSADRSNISALKLEAGYRLACNVVVDGDCAIEVSSVAQEREHGATVVSVRDVGSLLREIVLRPAVQTGSQFRPGSFIQIHVPPYAFSRDRLALTVHEDRKLPLDLPAQLTNTLPIRRAYSLSCSVATAGGNISLLVRFVSGRDGSGEPPGIASSYMYALKPGDCARFSGPFGQFALKESQHEKIFIGAGAGMAPLRAMVRAALTNGGGESLHFWYGARDLEDVPYMDEMEALAREHANFSWNLVLSGVPNGTHGVMTGLVQETARALYFGSHPDLSGCEFYLCGPPAMLRATRDLLRGLGVDDAMIAFDDFKI